jgi:hypothetical protein
MGRAGQTRVPDGGPGFRHGEGAISLLERG